IISSPRADSVSALTGETIITPQQGGEFTEPKPLCQVQSLNRSDAAPAPTVPTANVNWGKIWAAIACEAWQYESDGHAHLEMGIIFLTQIGAGILENASLLCLYNFTLLTGYKLRPTDQILNQLVLAKNLALFFRGIPQTMVAFALKYFLDDVGCKLVFYLYRVARGVSLSTTCLLSGFQAIEFCPRTSFWMEFRNRSPKCIGFHSFSFWILQLLAVILSSIVAMGVGFMIWTSGYTVFVLHRHKHSRLCPRTSHEARVIRTILILVSFFVYFYCLSSILTVCVTVIVNPGHWLVDTSLLIASHYPAFSPFVLISSDT
ncbi:hypothetical protein HPG69_007248, partial [Diceros bicornis minor]